MNFDILQKLPNDQCLEVIRDRLMQWSVSERVAEAEFLTHKLRYGLRGACVSGEFIYWRHARMTFLPSDIFREIICGNNKSRQTNFYERYFLQKLIIETK